MASMDSVSMMAITSYGPVTRSACTVSGNARNVSSTLLPTAAAASIKRYARIFVAINASRRLGLIVIRASQRLDIIKIHVFGQ